MSDRDRTETPIVEAYADDARNIALASDMAIYRGHHYNTLVVDASLARRLERSRRRNILRVVKLRRKCELYRAELSRLLDVLGKTDYEIVLDFLNKIETEG